MMIKATKKGKLFRWEVYVGLKLHDFSEYIYDSAEAALDAANAAGYIGV